MRAVVTKNSTTLHWEILNDVIGKTL